MSLSGLSGFSPAAGASPAEVEATLHREVMRAAAQAAVQAAMAGVNPPDGVVRAKMDGAGATRAAASRGGGVIDVPYRTRARTGLVRTRGGWVCRSNSRAWDE